MIIRNNTNNIENLRSLYEIINKMITNQDCYYMQEEVDKLKEDKRNVFIKGGGGNNGKY